MSFSKRLMDPDGYGLPPVSVCCGKIPKVISMKFVCPKCNKECKVKN